MIEQKNGDKDLFSVGSWSFIVEKMTRRNLQQLTIQHDDRVERAWNMFENKKKCNPIRGDDRQAKTNTEEVFRVS